MFKSTKVKNPQRRAIMKPKDIQELWDEYSEMISDDSHSFSQIADTDMMHKVDFEIAMKEYGDQRFIEGKKQVDIQCESAYNAGFIQGRDKALEWAAENVKTSQISIGGKTLLSVDTRSILSGKKNSDLQP